MTREHWQGGGSERATQKVDGAMDGGLGWDKARRTIYVCGGSLDIHSLQGEGGWVESLRCPVTVGKGSAAGGDGASLMY